MKIRQRVKRFDELSALKDRLETFISTTEANNTRILSFEGTAEDDHEIILAKEQLRKILDTKKAQLEVVKKEYKEHDYFLKKTKTDLDMYRNTIEYIGEE
jgi:regulator of replication initiation timing